jgi:hypothetical protein
MDLDPLQIQTAMPGLQEQVIRKRPVATANFWPQVVAFCCFLTATRAGILPLPPSP